jgi:hypothetical protein
VAACLAAIIAHRFVRLQVFRNNPKSQGNWSRYRARQAVAVPAWPAASAAPNTLCCHCSCCCCCTASCALLTVLSSALQLQCPNPTPLLHSIHTCRPSHCIHNISMTHLLHPATHTSALPAQHLNSPPLPSCPCPAQTLAQNPAKTPLSCRLAGPTWSTMTTRRLRWLWTVQRPPCPP